LTLRLTHIWLTEIFLWHFWETLCILLDLLAYFRTYLEVCTISPDFSTSTWLFSQLWITPPPTQKIFTSSEYYSNFTRFILYLISYFPDFLRFLERFFHFLFVKTTFWYFLIMTLGVSLVKKTFQLEIFLWHFWITLGILLDLFATFRTYLEVSTTSPDFSTPTSLLVKLWLDLPPPQNFFTFFRHRSNFTGFILLFISLLTWPKVFYSWFHFCASLDLTTTPTNWNIFVTFSKHVMYFTRFIPVI